MGFFRSPPIVSPFPLLNKQAAAARLFLKSTYSSAMDEPQAHPVCAQEALNLLNCVTESPFDQEKCYRLLHSLRECVLSKVFIPTLQFALIFPCFLLSIGTVFGIFELGRLNRSSIVILRIVIQL